VAQKADSHDICFIADGDTAGWLAGRLGSQPGQFVDESGAVVGEHDGAYAFTVGQRHGLRLGTPAPDGKPRYVLGIEPVSGQVRVGPAQSLAVSTVVATAPAFPSGVAATGLAQGRECLAQVRAHSEPVPCSAAYDGERLSATLHAPVRGVAAGQGLVLYDGERVLAAGRIESTGVAPAA
jgi:tRNA-specific 2-thiouridylase